MNREERRTQKKANHAFVATLPDILTPVPRDRWPEAKGKEAPFDVWWSKDFLVQLYPARDRIIRLSVCRTRMGEKSWLDGITWDELQAIKNTLGFSNYDAIEVYPRAADVVNVANMRHLWIMPEPLNFAWRKP